MKTRLTVFFEAPFWVGLFERYDDGEYSVCKVTFGAEPTDGEVWAFVLKHYDKLKFSPAVRTEMKQRADNPKRRQRNARKLLENTGIGTKAQQALAAQREENKNRSKRDSREQRDAEKQRQFDLKKQKRKEKHKGH